MAKRQGYDDASSADFAMRAGTCMVPIGAPYLCLRLDLDPATIGALMLEAKVPGATGEQPGQALSLSSITPELLDSAN